MEIKARFDHFNINVTDLERSIEFYGQALGLRVASRNKTADFELVFLEDDTASFRLELTWLKNHAGTPYELGENESHLCLRVPDYEGVKAFHREKGWICFENKQMGIYFINDPDDYWIEIIPAR